MTKFDWASLAICSAVAFFPEFLLRPLVGDWWPWFMLAFYVAYVVMFLIPDRHWARFCVWLNKHALRCCPVGLVVMPTVVPLLALLGEQDLAWKWVKLLAVYWAVMGPLLLLLPRQPEPDRKESK